MRVLLDEHLPLDLASEFIGHEVSSVRVEGWAGLKNGILLSRAGDAGFEVLVTNDKSLEFQQNLADVTLGIVVLDARSNKLGDLVPRVGGALEAIEVVRPGEVLHVAG